MIDIKSGRHVELEQRTTGRRLWAGDDVASDPTWPRLSQEVIELHEDRLGLAVALGLTHDLLEDVRRYCEENLPDVGRVLRLQPSIGPGAQTVACGRHAFELADAATSAIRCAKRAGAGCTHLFIAAPNAFTFYFGQRQRVIGPVHLYEFDFDGERGRSYTLALTLPVKPQG